MMNAKNFFMGVCSFLLIAGLGMFGSACSSNNDDIIGNYDYPQSYHQNFRVAW